MLRSLLLAATGLVLVGGFTPAADPEPPAGFWKINIPLGREGDLQMMVAFTPQDGKWIGDYLGASAKLRAEPKFKNLTVKGDQVWFDMEFGGRDFISFDGVLSKDKKKISGLISVAGGQAQPADLYPTKLRKLDDPFEVARETLTQVEGGPQLIDAAVVVLENAAAKKLPAAEAKALVERVNKAAAAYGDRWGRETSLRLARVLAGQEGLADLAVAEAKRAESLLTKEDTAATRMRVLEGVVRVLTAAGKADAAKGYRDQLAKLEGEDYTAYAKTLPIKPEAFAGRKGKSDRGVLVEVFTGAECPPCAGVDLAFDGLLTRYKPADVVFLQYHLHIPAPDPLTSPGSMQRADYYGELIEGTPTVFVAGKVAAPGGGPAAAAAKKYDELKKPIEEALDKAAGVKLGLAVSKGEKGGYSAKATVSDLEMPGEKVSLRFALAEERVRYAGGNGLRYHHMVVRSLPGGAKGFALTKKSSEQTVTFDPEEVRKELTRYLATFEKTQGEFPRPEKPLALSDLKLIAFIQNDATREVLTAVQVDVGEK
jgi:hypothetical protein